MKNLSSIDMKYAELWSNLDDSMKYRINEEINAVAGKHTIAMCGCTGGNHRCAVKM